MRIAIIVNCNGEKFFAKEKVPRMKEREREREQTESKESSILSQKQNKFWKLSSKRIVCKKIR